MGNRPERANWYLAVRGRHDDCRGTSQSRTLTTTLAVHTGRQSLIGLSIYVESQRRRTSLFLLVERRLAAHRCLSRPGADFSHRQAAQIGTTEKFGASLAAPPCRKEVLRVAAHLRRPSAPRGHIQSSSHPRAEDMARLVERTDRADKIRHPASMPGASAHRSRAINFVTGKKMALRGFWY